MALQLEFRIRMQGNAWLDFSLFGKIAAGLSVPPYCKRIVQIFRWSSSNIINHERHPKILIHWVLVVPCPLWFVHWEKRT